MDKVQQAELDLVSLGFQWDSERKQWIRTFLSNDNVFQIPRYMLVASTDPQDIIICYKNWLKYARVL